jgi:hypothetical protein
VLIAALTGAVSVAGLARAETSKPITLPLSNLKFTADGGFTPRALPKSTPTPVALTISGKVGALDGTHPPALRDLAIALDKNIAVNLSGYPSCHPSRIQTDPPRTPAEACSGSLIGDGAMVTEIQLAEVPPILVRSEVQIFNGTRKHGARTLYLYTYIAVPTPAWIVASAQIKQAHDGPYGTEAVISFPKIAGGSGSITSFDFRIKKRLPLAGKRFSPITARCPNGRLQFRDTATFFVYETSETFRAPSEVLRTCTGG